MKERVIRTPDQLETAARSLRSLGNYLPVRVMVDQYQRTRSVEQNAKLHALCRDVSAQKQWAGQKLDVEDWKRLFVDAWQREQGKPTAVVPSLDGRGVVSLGMQTRCMSVGELSELVEWIQAWGTEQGVEWHDEAA